MTETSSYICRGQLARVQYIFNSELLFIYNRVNEFSVAFADNNVLLVSFTGNKKNKQEDYNYLTKIRLNEKLKRLGGNPLKSAIPPQELHFRLTTFF